MHIIAKILAVIILVPLGLAGAIVAAGSLLSACGVPIGELLFSPGGWVAQFFSYCGWMIGAIVAYCSYLGLIWTFKGYEGVKEILERLPKDQYR